MIDSGFAGSFTLPAAAIAALGLAHQSGGPAVLAGGSIQQVDIYAAEVDWDGSRRSVLVMEVGGEALAGLRLWPATKCDSRSCRVVRWRSPGCLEGHLTK